MARVTVVFPPLSVSRDFIDYPYFADLGALQAAAVLRSAGHDVTLIDAFSLPDSGVERLDEHRFLLGVPEADVVQRLPRADVQIVAYTPFHRPPARDHVLGRILEAAARIGPVGLADLYQGGQHYVAAEPARILASYPEVGGLLSFEAEEDLDAFARRLAKGEKRFEIAGRETVEIDRLPCPAWDLVDLDRLFVFHERVAASVGRPRWAFPIDGRSVPALTSRGCPFRCIHCSSNPGRPAGSGKRQRRHSPAYLAGLFDLLVSRGARRVHVLDDLFNLDEAHFRAVVDLLEERSLALEVPNGFRADRLLDEHIGLLRGRVTTLSVSAESASDRVRNEIVKKGLRSEDVERVAATAAAAGIPTLVHFMIGLPGETPEEINETLRMAAALCDLPSGGASIQYATPLPGTYLFRMSARPSENEVTDFAPHFQQIPPGDTASVSRSTLARFGAAWRAREAARREPESRLRLSRGCNNRCALCPDLAREAPERRPGGLETLLRQGRSGGARSLLIEGGEPCLSPALLPLIARARELGYERVTVTTNGRVASYGGYASALARSGVTSLRIKLPAAEAATHACLTGVPEAFEQTIAGIRHLAASAPEEVDVWIDVGVSRANLTALGRIAELAAKLGVRRLRAERLVSADPTEEEVASAFAALAQDHGRDFALRFSGVPLCVMPGLEASVDVFHGVPGAWREACPACPDAITCAVASPRSPGPGRD